MIPTLHAVGMVQLVGSMATTRGAFQGPQGVSQFFAGNDQILLLMVQKSPPGM